MHVSLEKIQGLIFGWRDISNFFVYCHRTIVYDLRTPFNKTFYLQRFFETFLPIPLLLTYSYQLHQSACVNVWVISTDFKGLCMGK